MVASDAEYITVNKSTNAIEEKRGYKGESQWSIIYYYESETNKNGPIFFAATLPRRNEILNSLIKANTLKNGLKGLSTPLNVDRQPTVKEIPDSSLVSDEVAKKGITSESIQSAFSDEKRNPIFNVTPDQKSKYGDYFSGYAGGQKPEKTFS
jgi:hypothetical protein